MVLQLPAMSAGLSRLCSALSGPGRPHSHVGASAGVFGMTDSLSHHVASQQVSRQFTKAAGVQG